MADERAEELVEMLQGLADAYEDEEIVTAANETIEYVSQLTVAYRLNRERLKEVQRECRELKSAIALLRGEDDD